MGNRIDWQRRTKQTLCYRRGTINIRDEEAMLERSALRSRYFRPQPTKNIAAKPRKVYATPAVPRIGHGSDHLDPLNPYDQLEGADLSAPPWD